MLVYAEGKLLAVSRESFVDSENQKVEYCVNVVKSSSGIQTFNSKADFSDLEQEDGILVLRLSDDSEKKNRFKVSLVEVRVGGTLGLPEAEIR